MHTFLELKKAAKHVPDGMPVVSISLSGDSATQMLATALRGEAALRGLCLDLYETGYGSMEQDLCLPDSELRQHNPQYVVVYRSIHQLAARHAMASPEQQVSIAEEELAFYESLLSDPFFATRTLIALNTPMTDDGVFGGYAPKVDASLPSQIRALNHGLQQLAAKHANFCVLDVDALQAQWGREALIDEALYTTSEIEFTLRATAQLSERLINMVEVRRGTFRKVLVTDLDNTLWGGVVSEDGVGGLLLGHALGIGRAYADVQRWIKKLVERGIVLCVVSKNDEQTALQPFREHPDMILREKDVAVFLANWETKADNILHLSEVLHIGTDQMVFLDDNPFERNLVREGVPGICVPELPEDPALWVSHLSGLHLFDTASVSQADSKRTQQYREEAERVAFQRRFENEDAYLVSLQMCATVEGLTAYNLPRVAQLTQRSNQFNLRTRRYTEQELQSLSSASSADQNHCPPSQEAEGTKHVLCFSLRDKFGQHGLVSVVILERRDASTLFIDTWLMSCRVLKRGMEHFVANTIVETARKLGASTLQAEYIPTPKNTMVANLLPQMGFKPAPICPRCYADGRTVASTPFAVPYMMDIGSYEPKATHITLNPNTEVQP